MHSFSIVHRAAFPEFQARTITSSDIVNFACLTGDFNEVHTNYEYAKSTPFGEVIAHGPMIYGVAGGLQYASGINDGTLLALLGIDKWRMLGPVMHGDTIHMEQTAIGKRKTSPPGRAVITFKREIKKQDNSVVQEMEATIMYRCCEGELKGDTRHAFYCH